MSAAVETVSITAAAKRLGTSRTGVWRRIADGSLDAETVQRGARLVTRVILPQAGPGVVPPSRTAQLQEQVERLTRTVEHLSVVLAEAERERTPRADRWARSPAARPPRTDEDPATDRFPPGITARPNPMTHPAVELRSCRSVPRDELLEPVRELFRRGPRHRAGWLRLPLVTRD